MIPERHEVLIALGSNLGNRLRTLGQAVSRLRRWVDDVAVSHVYSTAPRYVETQPQFLNMAIGGWTMLSPFELLAVAQQVETELGRERSQRYGPRLIDIDLIYYGDRQMHTQCLTIPHPLRAERRFVLAPLNDIAPGFVDPATGRTVRQMLQALPREDDDCVSQGSFADLLEKQGGGAVAGPRGGVKPG